MRILLAIAMSAVMAAPVFAMDDMSCADFMAMDNDAQTHALMEMQEGMSDGDSMSSDTSGSMASDSMASDSMAADDPSAVVQACTDHPDMMVGDAIGGM